MAKVLRGAWVGLSWPGVVGALGVLGVLAVGCGGASTEAPPAAGAINTGSADAGAKRPPAAAAPVDVIMPVERPVPTLTLGSKIARVRGPARGDAIGDAPQPACANGSTGGDPSSLVAAMVKACAGAMKPVGPTQTVTMNERDVGPSIPLAATRACYRVFAAAPASVDGFVVIVTDSKGSVAAEGRASGRTLVLPADGPLCFESADAAKVVVSAAKGSGQGALAIVRE